MSGLEPVILTGRFVRLEPLSFSHLDDLCAAGLDPELWRWIPSSVGTREEMRNYIETALREQEAGVSLPFAVIHLSSGRAIGSTRYMAIALAHRRVEIGCTWYGRDYQRSPVNTECKLLLLSHAFETLGLIRVEFKTDALNEKSRNALARIGAVQEGIFRRHLICASGRIRDTVYFSILDREWPEKKWALEARLNAT
ncbi:MAG TPA: GNAT family protein [Rhizomicrobium sp.]|jgi:RimJ/RimL family protein N-acetyltransferase|nr:GNAT family protein [Rhizomicrobium sp.]